MTSGDRFLTTLERLLEISIADLKVALSYAADLTAEALRADKVDAFVYDEARDTLVAVGTSQQPLSALERKHGLDTLPLANGGRVVDTFRSGITFVHGALDTDESELKGIRETLQVKSLICIALMVGAERRGVLAIASQTKDLWSADDVRFAESVARWVGTVALHATFVEEIERNAVAQGRRAAADELVTELAHDLRSYISPLDMRLYIMRTRAEHDKRADDLRDIDLLRRGVGRVAAVISDILDIGRLDNGALAISPEPLNLKAVVQDLIEPLSTPQQPIHLRAYEENIVVIADPARIRQCLQNVIANALKYSPQGVPVVVNTSRYASHDGGGELAKIEVIDQGPGVAPSVLPRIFERFVAGSEKRSGLGLGLFLAKQIATLHGGDLVVSASSAKGTTFTLTIPSAG